MAEYCSVHNLLGAEDTPVGTAVTAGRGEVELRTLFRQSGVWTLDAIVMAFETLVPAGEAKRYGEVFTLEAITSFMASEAVNRIVGAGVDLHDVTVIDPADGRRISVRGTLRC